jgi:hypothetical protein
MQGFGAADNLSLECTSHFYVPIAKIKGGEEHEVIYY